MKKHFILFASLLGMMMIVLSSCNTTQTFIVHGTPGTVISNKNNVQMAVVDQTGLAKITLDRHDGYQHFLLAQAPGSNVMVPFALDYKDHSRDFQISLCKGTALFFLISGAATSVAGLIGFGTGDSAIGVPLTFGGLGVMALGIPFSIIGSRDPIEYDYDFQKVQSTNNNLVQ